MNPQQPYTPQPNGSAPQPEQQPPQPNAPATAPYVPYYATQAASHGAQDYGYGAYNPATHSQPTQPPHHEQQAPSSPQPQATPYQLYQPPHDQPASQPAASYGAGQSYHYAPQPEQQSGQPSQQPPATAPQPTNQPSSHTSADPSQNYASTYPSPSQPAAQPYQPQSGGYNGQAYANPQQPLGATAMAATGADLGAASEPDTSFPVDYLNEIAPKPQPVQMNRFAVFGLIGGVLLLAFSVVMMMVNSQPNYTKQAQSTLARIETLQAATKEQQSRLTENELSSMNTTLTTSLGSMGTELKSSLKDAKIKTELVGDAKKTEKAYSDKLSKTLEDAYLTGSLDRVYAREMSYQLSILKSYLQKLKTASGNRKAIADYVATNSKTLDAATKSFSNFTSTK